MLLDKQKNIPVFFTEFIDNMTAVFNSEVRDKVFGSTPGKRGRKLKAGQSQKVLGRITGRTFVKGFQFVKHRRPGNGQTATIFTGHFFARIANLFENWKNSNRPKIKITLQARQAFEKSAKFNSSVDKLTRQVSE